MQLALEGFDIPQNAVKETRFHLDDSVGQDTKISLTYQNGDTVGNPQFAVEMLSPSGAVFASNNLNIITIDTRAKILNLKVPGKAEVNIL